MNRALPGGPPRRGPGWHRALALCLLWLACLGAVAQEVALTPEERVWVATHPHVRAVAVVDTAPYYLRGEDGKAIGFAAELLKLALERAGLDIDYVWVADAREAYRLFVNGSVDMTPIAASSPARAGLALFPGPLLTTELVSVTRADLPMSADARDLAGRRVAVVSGQVAEELLRADFPEMELVSFTSFAEALRAVSVGQCDVAVGWLHGALYQIEADLLANLRVNGRLGVGRVPMGPAVSPREPLLNDILRKALATLTPAERSAAAQNWLPRGAAAQWAPGRVELGAAERDWIERMGEVRVGFPASAAPFSQRGVLGRHVGLGPDVLRLAADKVGLRVGSESSATSAALPAQALAGDLDIVVGMTTDATLREDFELIGPFVRSPTVMVMRRDDGPLWRQPDEIAPRARVGVVAGHLLARQLRVRRPGLQLVEFADETLLLAALDRREIDAAIVNGMIATRLIEERYAGALRVTGILRGTDSDLYFGVPKGRHELSRLLDTGFTAITPGETAALRQRWLLLSVDPSMVWLLRLLPWLLALGAAVLAGLLAAVGLLWRANRRLRLSRAAGAAPARLRASP